MKKFIICISILFIGFILLNQTGCAQERGAASGGIGIGGEALNFTLTDLDGKKLSLEKSIGKEVILLIFSTTWCPSCRKKISSLKKIHNEYDK